MDKVVLLFDDDFPKVMANIIEAEIGCLCLPYDNGRECLNALEEGLKFDLFFTDLAVENTRIVKTCSNPITGNDLGKKVKSLYSNVPIITCSGYDFKPSFSNYHLVKPVSFEELEEEIRNFL